jgi:hypothetical protein
LLKSLQLPAAAKAATDFAAVTARLEAAPFQNAISNAIENAILKRDRNSSFSAACIDKHILAKRIFILLTNPAQADGYFCTLCIRSRDFPMQNHEG